MTQATGKQTSSARTTEVRRVRRGPAATTRRPRGAVMKLCRSMAAATLVTTATGGAALAQMYLPDARIQADDTTNVYFGSTKDVDGHFLSGVAAEVRGGNATYVMVTDDAGRFKIRVPKTLPASALKVGCSKPGYVLVRVVKRPPPKGATSPMQADCILAPGRTAAK